jgi:hypothetical protein
MKKESNQPEPYEVMPDTTFKRPTPYILIVALSALVVGLLALIPSCAQAETTAKNWCAEWKEGYEDSFYLMCRSCQTIEPKECPEPMPDERDGYMRGVNEGSADGKREQKVAK